MKQPGSYPTPAQRHQMDLIRRAGGVATVVRSAAEALEAIHEEAPGEDDGGFSEARTMGQAQDGS